VQSLSLQQSRHWLLQHLGVSPEHWLSSVHDTHSPSSPCTGSVVVAHTGWTLAESQSPSARQLVQKPAELQIGPLGFEEQSALLAH